MSTPAAGAEDWKKKRMKISRSIQIGDQELTLETGRIAKQADGSCLAQYGDTVVLTTACMATSGRPRPFLPLTVDYREYTYAGGRIPGGFFKREGRPSEKEIITCRQIDRPIRPLFPEGYFNETQIVGSVLSADGENDPDVLAINGASTALMLSKIPFYDPLGAVRVGLIEGEIVFNPTNSLRDVSDLDLMVVGTEQAIAMVEAGANQLSEKMVLECIFRGHEEIQKVIQAQREMMVELGIEKPEWIAPESYSSELFEQVKADLGDSLKTALHTKGKFEQRDADGAVTGPYIEALEDDESEEKANHVKKIIKTLEEAHLRDTLEVRPRIPVDDDDREIDGVGPRDARRTSNRSGGGGHACISSPRVRTFKPRRSARSSRCSVARST